MNLEKLYMSRVSSKLTITGLSHVMGVLAQGVCPRLRRLNLSYNYWGHSAGNPIAEALSSGYFKCLQELDISYAEEVESGWFNPVAEALGGGACPDLRKLFLYSCSLIATDGLALGTLLRSGACPRMEALALSYNRSLGNEGIAAIAAGLDRKRCPDLLRLEMAHIEVTSTGGEAMARTISKGCLGRLQWLDIGQFCSDLVTSQRVVRGLHHLRSLRKLDLTDTTTDIWQALYEVLRSRACIKLEVLLVAECPRLGDDGVVQLARALEVGGCPELRELSLCNVSMGEKGAIALSQAILLGGLRQPKGPE